MPILVKNVAEVHEAGKPRLGQVSRDTSNDVIEGIVVMRKGENPTDVLDKIHDKVTELNTNILPKDVKIVPFYDRTNLMDLATETVLHNLAEGIILVTVIVMLLWQTGERRLP